MYPVMKGTVWVALLTDKQQRGVKAQLPWYSRCKNMLSVLEKGKRAGAILVQYVSASGGPKHVQHVFNPMLTHHTIWQYQILWVNSMLAELKNIHAIIISFYIVICIVVLFSLYLESLLIHFFSTSSHCCFVCFDHTPFSYSVRTVPEFLMSSVFLLCVCLIVFVFMLLSAKKIISFCCPIKIQEVGISPGFLDFNLAHMQRF